MKYVLRKMKVIAFMMAVVLTATVLQFSGEGNIFTKDYSGRVLAAQEGEEQTSGSEITTEHTSETATTGSQKETESTTAKVKKITPAAVTELSATSTKTNAVTISWKASKNATEYVIYRSAEKKNGKMSKLKKIKTVKLNAVEDTGLKQGTKYQYAVYAYRIANGKKTHSSAVKVTVLTKPESVVKVQVSKKTAKSVQIQWTKNAKANKYIVYRAAEQKNGKLGKYKKVKTVKNSQNTYTDKKISVGKIYGYKIVVQRTSGSLNTYSSGKTVKTMTVLATPTKLKKKKTTTDSIKLTWKKVKNANQYEIYRDGKLIKTTKTTNYTDKKLETGTTYEYAVKAVRIYHKKKYKSEAAYIDAATSDVLNGTWVEVSIAKQMMYMYVKGKLYVKTPVVTGNAGALSTTKGRHHVLSKSSPARLQGSYNGSSWDVTVNYWLGFTTDGQGLHDSTWRSAYGGSIYRGNGSHGCVNTPLAAMKKIYGKAYIGMPVIVH